MSLPPNADRNCSILVIEDDILVAEFMVSMLMDEGYTVYQAGTAEEAVKSLASRKFNLVLCDLALPGMMDGLSLARSLRMSNPAVPILLVTGYGDRAADAAPDFIVLKKPFGIAELGRIVAWALRNGGTPYLGMGQPSGRDLH